MFFIAAFKINKYLNRKEEIEVPHSTNINLVRAAKTVARKV